MDKWPDTYDLISGLVGVGNYALTTGSEIRSDAVQKVVKLLLAMGESDGGLTWWRTSAKWRISTTRNVGEHIDLGLAHGNAGVIAFLSRVELSGMSISGTGEALRGAMTWLLNHRNVDPGCASDFAYTAERRNVSSRAAWCYGDVGMATAIYAAGTALHESTWLGLAEAMARRCASRPLDQMGFDHASLCHGPAGVAHILAKFNERNPDALLRSTCELLLAASYGWRQCEAPGHLHADLGYLEGKVGVALALLSSCATPAIRWDYPLIID